MTRASAKVPTRWWSEHRFLGLSGNAQRLLFALWTMPETNLTGIGLVSHAALAERLHLSAAAVRSAMDELARADFIKADTGVRQVWLKGYIEAQLGGPPSKSAAWLVNTTVAVDALSPTALVREYREHFGLPAGDNRPAKEGSRKGEGLVEGPPRRGEGLGEGRGEGREEGPVGVLYSYMGAQGIGIPGTPKSPRSSSARKKSGASDA